MYFNCKTDNSMTFIEVSLKPEDDPITKRVEKVKFNFLNSEDGKYTISGAIQELENNFPWKCDIKKGRYTIKGKLKGTWNCNIENIGDVVIKDTVNLSAKFENMYEEFSVTISK